MHLGTPTLAFIGTTMAIGAVCLSYLKARYRTTNHHLLVFAVVAAVGYLAPMQIGRASQLERERLQGSWAATARALAHELERADQPLAQVEEPELRQRLARAIGRHDLIAEDLRSATLLTRRANGTFSTLTANLSDDSSEAYFPENCLPKIQEAMSDREVWCEERDPDGRTTGMNFLAPLRDLQNATAGVMMVHFSARNWRSQQELAEWRVVAEFLGLLSICVLMSGMLVSNVERRRQQEMEKAVANLRTEVESLDGMVNAVNGVVWQRHPHRQRFSFASQQAEGCFGYSLDQWLAEDGFLKGIIHEEDLPRAQETWQRALENGKAYHVEYRVRRADGAVGHVVEHGQAARVPLHGSVLRGILLDVTAQKEAEAAIKDMHRLMLESSRQAGMAEIASGVLHNVGNVLNSLNVGAKLLLERMQRSRLDRLCDATAMLKQHVPGDLQFLVSDKRGQALPSYLEELAVYLRDEQQRLAASVSDIIDRVDRIRDVILLQQTHSNVHALQEPLDVATVMEEALRLEAGANQGQIPYEVERQYADLPPVPLARGLLLQVLVALFANATHAMAGVAPELRKLMLRLGPNGAGGVRIIVEDNGCGLAQAELVTIFRQGYSTKAGGHGFGLHHAALVADDLGGSLRAESEGPGRGARFILDLPTEPPVGSPASSAAALPSPSAAISKP
jgi:PAS domain S-box-containing protein